ncbi:MAG: hypothetical protein P4L53_15980 [Candidatus Obscuribacterales bacterium]|nr:hypothetical protein [Candidatus Obscuribacterales bacterium]
MVGARSVIKLFASLLVIATSMFASAEARRAYQTIEDQDVAPITAAAETRVDVVVQTKRQAQTKQDKLVHPALMKIVPEKKEQAIQPEQILSSPLDCMIQFEKENPAGLKNQTVSASEQATAEVVTPSKVQDKTLSVTARSSNQSSGLPIDIAITAIAIGVCCYAFSRKFLFRERKTTISKGREAPNHELNLKA